MLLFFHSLCAVLWFEEPELRELVMIDPQWLIDGISCIVRNFTLHPMPCDKECNRKYETEWAVLTHEAKLSTKLLPLLWQEERFAQHTNLLLRLMVRFGLALAIRGKKELIVAPLLISNGSKPPIVHEPQGALHFLLHFAHYVPQSRV
jgi:hypothetical protein